MATKSGAREVADLSRAELVRVVDHIRAVLWLDLDDVGDVWNPDKEWSVETIEHVASALIETGLRPEKETRG